MSTNAPWKAITVSKGVYLPTIGTTGAFKDSGLRVEPADKIEIRPGSNTLRVNGVEHALQISVDTLRLDEKNCVMLDKPAPRVGSLHAGDGHSTAWVGRIGMHPRLDDAGEGFGAETCPAPGPQMHLVAAQDIDPAIFAEDALIQEITLLDGSKANVYLDPSTGRPCSAPFRRYGGIGLNPKEALRLLAEQDAETVLVTSPQPPAANYTQQTPSRSPVPHIAKTPGDYRDSPALSAPQAASSGNLHLDGFIGQATKTGAPGYPLGQITCIAAPEAVRVKLQGATAPCVSLEAAFARIHLSKAPVVFVHLGRAAATEALTDTLRLELAEQLPTLAEVIQQHGQVALVLLCPDSWPQLPALLKFIPTVVLTIATHATDDRFWAVTCTKGSPTGAQPTASFPA